MSLILYSKFLNFLVFFCFLLTGLCGCKRLLSSDPIILTINQKSIRSREFAEKLALKAKSFPLQSLLKKDMTDHLKKQLIQDLSMEEVIHQWAGFYRIRVSEKEVLSRLKTLKNPYPSSQIWQAFLKKNHSTEDQMKTPIRFRLLSQKVMDHITKGQITPPSLKETKAYYTQNQSSFLNPPQIQIRQIVHNHKKTLHKVREQIRKGGDFKKLARSFSTHPKKEKPEWVTKGTLDVFDQVFTLKKNQISQVLSSPYGYHIIQVLDHKKSSLMSFQQAQSTIQNHLTRMRKKAFFRKWLDKQKQKLHIRVHSSRLKQIKIKVL